jgi:hypothetical protein
MNTHIRPSSLRKPTDLIDVLSVGSEKLNTEATESPEKSALFSPSPILVVL